MGDLSRSAALMYGDNDDDLMENELIAPSVVSSRALSRRASAAAMSRRLASAALYDEIPVTTPPPSSAMARLSTAAARSRAASIAALSRGRISASFLNDRVPEERGELILPLMSASTMAASARLARLSAAAASSSSRASTALASARLSAARQSAALMAQQQASEAFPLEEVDVFVPQQQQSFAAVPSYARSAARQQQYQVQNKLSRQGAFLTGIALGAIAIIAVGSIGAVILVMKSRREKLEAAAKAKHRGGSVGHVSNRHGGKRSGRRNYGGLDVLNPSPSTTEPAETASEMSAAPGTVAFGGYEAMNANSGARTGGGARAALDEFAHYAAVHNVEDYTWRMRRGDFAMLLKPDGEHLQPASNLKAGQQSFVIMLYKKDCPYTEPYAVEFCRASANMRDVEIRKQRALEWKAQMAFCRIERDELPEYMRSESRIKQWPSFLFYSPIDDDVFWIDPASPSELYSDLDAIHLNVHQEGRPQADWILSELAPLQGDEEKSSRSPMMAPDAATAAIAGGATPTSPLAKTTGSRSRWYRFWERSSPTS